MGAGGGIFMLYALLALLPARIVLDYFNKIRALNPRDQALTKTCHGAGILVLGLWAYGDREGIGLAQAAQFLARMYFVDAPVGKWVTPLLLTIAACGLYWLVTGWSAAKVFGEQAGVDGFLRGRAWVKIAFGVGLALLLTDRVGGRFLDRELWYLLLDLRWPVAAIGIWCVITGATKLVLLWSVKTLPQQLPPVAENPHGRAGNASYAEALRAMQGHGGEKSRLDNREF